jgi:co-chaperonin GroES (HSP10)
MIETIHDIVLCKPVPDDYHVSGLGRASGRPGVIYIPDWVRDAHDRGVVRCHVMVVGPDCKVVKVGDIVIVNKPWAHWENLSEYDGTRCAFLHENQLLAIVEEDQ